jgi:hypothetical protein
VRYSATVDTVTTNIGKYCISCCHSCDVFRLYESQVAILTSDIDLTNQRLLFRIDLNADGRDTTNFRILIGTNFLDAPYESFNGRIIGSNSELENFVSLGNLTLQGIHFDDVFAQRYQHPLVSTLEVDSVYYSKEKGLIRFTTISGKNFTRIN